MLSLPPRWGSPKEYVAIISLLDLIKLGTPNALCPSKDVMAGADESFVDCNGAALSAA
jgi:hypothetical protein